MMDMHERHRCHDVLMLHGVIITGVIAPAAGAPPPGNPPTTDNPNAATAMDQG